MDIRLRGPDVSLEQEHSKPSASSGTGRELVDTKEACAILPGSFSPASLTIRRPHSLVERSLGAGENAGVLRGGVGGVSSDSPQGSSLPGSRLTQSKGSTKIKKYYHIDGGKHAGIYHDQERAGHDSQGDS